AGRYFSAVESGESRAAYLPIEEVLGLAAKLKKEAWTESGMADQVAFDAERFYLEKLKALDSALHEEYLQTRNNDLSKEQKREIFKRLKEVFPDTQIKLEYIEKRMKLDVRVDRGYLLRACDNIA